MENLLGIALKILAALLFTMMTALIKSLDGAFPTGQVVFFRSFFAIMPLLIMVLFREGIVAGLSTRNVIGHFKRGAIGCLAMFCGFTSLVFLPLPDATAIGYAAPLIAVALSAVLLKEEVRIYRWSAVAIGFAGVIVMLWPHLAADDIERGSGSGFGAMLALAGATCSAFAIIQIRQLTKTEPTSAIVFYFSTFCTIIGLATLPLGWIMPHGAQLAALIGAGLLGGVAQICMTQAYRFASAAVVAPFDYTTMIWAVLLGYFLFGDLPSRYVIAGGAIVVLAGLFVIWREHRLGLERGKGRRARTPNVAP